MRGTVWERVDVAKAFYGALTTAGGVLGKLHISPNVLTLVSLAIAGAAGGFVLVGQFGVGAALMIASGLCDGAGRRGRACHQQGEPLRRAARLDRRSSSGRVAARRADGVLREPAARGRGPGSGPGGGFHRALRPRSRGGVGRGAAAALHAAPSAWCCWC